MNTILALYPNNRGTGFACVEMPQSLLDHGIIRLYPLSSGRITKRLKKYIEFYRPKVVVMRENLDASLKSTRIHELIEEVKQCAKENEIDFHQYSRAQIKEVFEQFGASRKYEIARKIIEWFPELSDKAPRLRKAWQDEDYNMAVFDAISLAVAHEYIGE